jgi:hypothetical protein
MTDAQPVPQGKFPYQAKERRCACNGMTFASEDERCAYFC